MRKMQQFCQDEIKPGIHATFFLFQWLSRQWYFILLKLDIFYVISKFNLKPICYTNTLSCIPFTKLMLAEYNFNSLVSSVLPCDMYSDGMFYHLKIYDMLRGEKQATKLYKFWRTAKTPLKGLCNDELSHFIFAL